MFSEHTVIICSKIVFFSFLQNNKTLVNNIQCNAYGSRLKYKYKQHIITNKCRLPEIENHVETIPIVCSLTL